MSRSAPTDPPTATEWEHILAAEGLSILSYLRDFIAVVDQDLMVRFVNRTVAQPSTAAARGVPILAYFPPPSARPSSAAFGGC